MIVRRDRWGGAITCLVAVAAVGATHAAGADPRWGRLANAQVGVPVMKATLFFAGQARDGTHPYGCQPASNLGLYTVHPGDGRHLNWHTSASNRLYVIDDMVDVGINVIAMSSWGESFLPCSTGWVPWAPMQTAPQAHDELFIAAADRPVTILPFIESRGDWAFRDEFPTTAAGQVAPGTVSQIVDLINRYLKNAAHPEWASRWARVYDRDGVERYAVAIIHASSNRLTGDADAAYAAGFEAMAQRVLAETGVRVGFFLDALPPGTWAPGVFRPSAAITGPHLVQQPAVLGIMCFLPEIWLGSSDDATLIAWKRWFSRQWEATGLPFIMDVCPGYDAHIVFPGSVSYGLKPSWTTAMGALVDEFGRDGLIFSSWNGYTEAMAAVPTVEHGSVYHEWLRTLPRHPADLDWDGDADMDDVGLMQRCLGAAAAGDCRRGDLNGDDIVNALDMTVLRACLGGAEVLLDSACLAKP